MNTSLPRRSVAAGLAWTVPAVAATAAAPFAAASPVTTDDCKDNLPEGVGPFWPSNGSHSISSTGGGSSSNVSSTFNYAMNDTSRTGSVSIYFNDGAAQSWVAQPYITLNNGQTYCGFVALAGTATFVAPAGVSTSLAVNWLGTGGMTDDALWNGAVAHIPFIYWYTLNGTLYSAQYEMLMPYPATNGWSPLIQSTTVTFVKPSYGCLPQSCSTGTPIITGATPNYAKAGDTITIEGTGFTGAAAVTYNGRPITYTVVSDTEIHAIMPTTGSTGTIWGTVYDLVVCNAQGCSDGFGLVRGD